jgi:hypothetical protein
LSHITVNNLKNLRVATGMLQWISMTHYT